ncbi:MAG: hypothetical protein M3171_10060 [Actinomycetota bacterium]|nr:hypothetical protein [Actinomycetota bacterium]
MTDPTDAEGQPVTSTAAVSTDRGGRYAKQPPPTSAGASRPRGTSP